MPEYIYKCQECSRKEEVFESITSSGTRGCSCGAEMKRVPQVCTVIWKNTGKIVTKVK